jgi:hypothetical protein
MFHGELPGEKPEIRVKKVMKQTRLCPALVPSYVSVEVGLGISDPIPAHRPIALGCFFGHGARGKHVF